MDEIREKVSEAVGSIRSRHPARPRLGIILGSGLGSFAGRVGSGVALPYSSIPNFPIPTVEGHAGNLVLGDLLGVPVAVMQGRYHYYEGYFMREVTFPVRVLAGLGAGALITTNAAGGIMEGMEPGDFMAVVDHINMMGANPLVGVGPDEDRSRFLDLSRAYDEALVKAAFDAAHEKGVRLHKGVLAAVSGPSYETPAEIRMLKALGADAVCMSTVPEVIMARYLGMRVLGLSLITNKAAGLAPEGPSHSDVLKVAGGRHADFVRLIEGVVACMS